MKRAKLAGAFMLGLGLLGLTACGGSEHGSEQRGQPEAVRAEVATVAPRQVENLDEVVGTVQSRMVSTLSSETSGQVVAVRVQLGDRVRRGQTLVQIDSRTNAAQLGQAEAGIEEAKAGMGEVDQAIEAAQAGKAAASAQAKLAASTYQRFAELLEKKSVSQQEFDEAEARHVAAQAEVARAEAMLQSVMAKRGQVQARIEQAEAGAKTARVQLGFSSLTAPFDGRITEKRVEPGDLAYPGAPLLTLEDDGGYRLEVAVEESRMSSVAIGQTLPVRIDALGLESQGKIVEVRPQADPATRSFLVKIELPSQPGLRSGMFGRAWLASGSRQLLTIPNSALVRRGQLTGVFVVDSEKRARFRLVRTGRETAEWTEVLSGLSQGQTFIVEPGTEIREGAPIL